MALEGDVEKEHRRSSGWKPVVIGAGLLGVTVAAVLGASVLTGVDIPQRTWQQITGQYQEPQRPNSAIPLTPFGTPAATAAIQTPTPAQAYVPPYQSDLELRLAINEALKPNRVLTPQDIEVWKILADVQRTIYFNLSGQSLEAAGIRINILTAAEFNKEAAKHFKPNDKGEYGVKGFTVLNGDKTANTYVLGEDLPGEVNATIAHENGIASAGLRINGLNQTAVLTYQTISEMSAFMYEGAAARRLDELGFPLYTLFETRVNRFGQELSTREQVERLRFLEQPGSQDFYLDGMFLAWAANLDEPEIRQRLENGLPSTSELSYAALERLIGTLTAENADEYVEQQHGKKEAYRPIITKNLSDRIVKGRSVLLQPAPQSLFLP